MKSSKDYIEKAETALLNGAAGHAKAQVLATLAVASATREATAAYVARTPELVPAPPKAEIIIAPPVTLSAASNMGES